jgi:hypothetical protein
LQHGSFPQTRRVARYPIAALTDVSLTSYELAWSVATVLGAELMALRAEYAEQLAKRDTVIEALRAEVDELRKRDDPDLDAVPPRGGPLKRVCELHGRTGWSETRLRTWARTGRINSKYAGGRLFIDERDVPVKKRKSE